MSRIYELRSKKGLSQTELAKLAGVSQRSISRWENDEVAIPLDKAVNVANALGCDLGDLTGISPAPESVLTGIEEELVELFRNAGPDGQDLIMQLARFAASTSR